MSRTATQDRVRNYCRTQPSFTAAFAAWELGVHQTTVNSTINELLAEDKLVQVEERKGPFAAVYRWKLKADRKHVKLAAQTTTMNAAELEDRTVAYVTAEPNPTPRKATR